MSQEHYKHLMLITMFCLLCIPLTKAQNLVVDQGNGFLEFEAARFNLKDFGYVSFVNNGTFLGNLGLTYGWANKDISLGTTSSNINGKLHLLSKGLPAITVTPSKKVGIHNEDPFADLDINGSVRISSLAGYGVKPVFADLVGNLFVNQTSFGRHDIHYAEFMPTNDDLYDEGYIERKNRHGLVQADGNFSDEGFLSAPITNLPSGAKIEFINVFYINESNSDFKIGVKIEPKLITNSGAFASVTYHDLPSAGYLDGSCNFCGGQMNIVKQNIQFNPMIPVTFDNLYTIDVECKDCSEQYIRAVEVYYQY